MKREISIAVVSSLVTAFILFVSGNMLGIFDKELTETQITKLANKITDNENGQTIIRLMANSGKFKGDPGVGTPGNDAQPRDTAQSIITEPELRNKLLQALDESTIFMPVIKSVDFTMVDFSSTKEFRINEASISITTAGRPVLLFVSNGKRDLGLENSYPYLNFEINRYTDVETSATTIFETTFYVKGGSDTLPVIALDQPPAGNHRYEVMVKGHPEHKAKHNFSGTLVAIEF